MLRKLIPLLLCLLLPLAVWGGEAVPYVQLTITRPAADETIHDNSGNLTVEVTLSPALQGEQGHRIQLYLDGIAVGNPSGLSLTEIDRGAHSLQAVVVDRDGRALIASAPVPFYMWRASALFRHH